MQNSKKCTANDNVCISKILVTILTPTVTVIRGGAFGRTEPSRIEVVSLSKGSLPPSAMWGHKEETASLNQEADPQQTPSLLTP